MPDPTSPVDHGAAHSGLPEILSARIRAVIGIDPELRPATKPQFGHFQCNAALRLAKSEGKPPREVAQRIVDALDVADLCEPPQVAGPGFINLRLRAAVLADAAERIRVDDRVGIEPVPDPRTVVIDYSAPNVAKSMHVGHLRTTIIGDCFRRVLGAVGHHVIAQNHIGDWGRQFGMLIEQIADEGIDPASLTLDEADALYKRANAHFAADEEFATRSRARVKTFQDGDPESLAIWRQLIAISTEGFNAAYDRLDVLLTDADLAGESTYNADLPVVCDELEASGVGVIDEGALCVFTEGFDAPLIVRKSDGGYGYATTDLAAIRHRVNDFHADRIIYVTDVRQGGHFAQVFAAARRAGFLPPEVSAEHIGYGMVLGTDGKPFKTRDGTAATLTSLLDAADAEAPHPIALAAIKYADLSSGLQKDYVFDAERMVQTTGDTGPYLQYAHARCCQVLRHAGELDLTDHTVTRVDEPAEQALAMALSRFGDVVADLARNLQPHKLCTYLFDLATAYSTFYEQCPVLKADGEVRASRLGLCAATRNVLATGLDLLGIRAPERM